MPTVDMPLEQLKTYIGLDYVDKTRVGAFRCSQGSALTVACAALVPQIKLASIEYPYLSDYKRV